MDKSAQGQGCQGKFRNDTFRKLKLLLMRNLSFPSRRREIAVGPMLLLATKCRAERAIGEVKDENEVQDCIALVTWSLCRYSGRMEMLTRQGAVYEIACSIKLKSASGAFASIPSLRGDESSKAILAPDAFRRCILPTFQNDKSFL